MISGKLRKLKKRYFVYVENCVSPVYVASETEQEAKDKAQVICEKQNVRVYITETTYYCEPVPIRIRWKKICN